MGILYYIFAYWQFLWVSYEWFEALTARTTPYEYGKGNYTMAKPDNREDNVEKLQETVQNSVQNLEEAETYLAEHAEEISAEERSQIEAKNENRRESIEGMRHEIRDEAQAQQQNPDA